ncbi:4-alpha-glucanotransferase [Conexibacter sp. DBS9H8]|uniref:4-alpha-glucanotransferase n=1 Tax=Conexibacter sp. DBS9H8 TaxID=2937801 RepID=UPI00200CC3FC|nr:4-alpha-glucanotransferase [Conexibacter sp. DBS9H8]
MPAPPPTPAAERAAGVQCHITSLPGGRLGAPAFTFVDWLAAARQRWWQVLPLAPPDRYGSPYKARSAFAIWPGLLAAPRARVSAAERIDFTDRHAYWITDWARLERGRRDEVVADQVRAEREWTALRTYAHDRGVALCGDLAIYVAPGSADHRAHPELFQDGAVAGAPPDAFTARGQLWGNPLYDWGRLAAQRYEWWVRRLAHTLALVDAARLDHFRGFVAYWSVPAGDPDARGGRWRRGPGRALFDAFSAQLGDALALIAEDLGVITPAVERLRDDLGLPGMLVLQFGFSAGDRHSPHAPANHPEHRWVYTGTHDHDTARGWFESLDQATADRVTRAATGASVALGLRLPAQSWWRLISLAHASPAKVAMVQAQDVLGLGSEARMNDPGRPGGNWRWQMPARALGAADAGRLAEITEASGRG